MLQGVSLVKPRMVPYMLECRFDSRLHSTLRSVYQLPSLLEELVPKKNVELDVRSTCPSSHELVTHTARIGNYRRAGCRQEGQTFPCYKPIEARHALRSILHVLDPRVRSLRNACSSVGVRGMTSCMPSCNMQYRQAVLAHGDYSHVRRDPATDEALFTQYMDATFYPLPR